MAAFFFDSCALVKRYVPETGTAWVDSITNPASGNSIHIAVLTLVEVIAALARRGRGGSLTISDVTGAIAQLRQDMADEYHVTELSPGVIARAATLAETHALRGYDTVQLAAALEVNAVRVAAGEPPLTLVSADGELNAAAAAEGLPVEDPNLHP
jgi:predicted nucleic acid-binding protein